MKKLVILIGMPGSGKSFVAEQLQRHAPQLKIANSSDALVELLASKKGLTPAQILAKKEVYRPELIELGDKLSVGGNLIMHYACRGVDVLTGVRRIEELEAVHAAQNIQILTVYVVSDILCTPDNLTVTPSHCDSVLFNPRIRGVDLTQPWNPRTHPYHPYWEQNDEFKQILEFIT